MRRTLRFGWRVPTEVGKVAGFRTAIAVVGRGIESRDVAQFGSALGSGPRGRGFKSRRPDHLLQMVEGRRLFYSSL